MFRMQIWFENLVKNAKKRNIDLRFQNDYNDQRRKLNYRFAYQVKHHDVMMLLERVISRWVDIYMREICSASRVSLAIVYHCDNKVIVSLKQ